jgi:hypothetical protein
VVWWLVNISMSIEWIEMAIYAAMTRVGSGMHNKTRHCAEKNTLFILSPIEYILTVP